MAVRFASIVAALLVPCAVAGQTTTTTAQTPDGRTYTVTTTDSPDGIINQLEIRPAPNGGSPGVAAPVLPPRDAAPATGTSHIRGRVTDAASGMPVRKAIVTIFAPEMRQARSTTTDAEGRYEFSDLPAGNFNVTANKTGYVNVSYGQSAPNEVGRPLRIADKQVVEKIDLSLPRGAVITGRVLDEYGEPVADVMVSALRTQYTVNGPRPMNAGRGAATNDIGEFRIFGLPPGLYLLSATYRQMMPATVSAGDNSGYALTYYPGTANPADAQRLAVGTGGSVSDVTLMLVPTRTARVSGIVVDAQGRPARQGSVMLMARTATVAMTSGNGPIRPDGTFTIGSVSPGDYTIRAMMPSQPGGPPETAMATVAVNGIDVTDLRVEPVRPITVTGRIVLDPVTARTFKPETVRVAAPLNDPGPLFGPMPPPVAVRDDLTFEFKASRGSSIVRVSSASPDSHWMIKSVTLNGADVTDGITFEDEDVTGLEVELTDRVPNISGLVTDGKGDAVRDYFAVAFPQDQQRWTAPGPGRTAMARPDDQGRFRFESLRPGNYYIAAVDHVQNGEWMDPAFMEAVHTYATRISVNEGDLQTLDLRLIQMR